jgi:2-methylcitrate dehydratase PrpD
VELTSALARACRDVRFDALSADVLFTAKQCVLDWLGVTLGGSHEPLAQILREEVRDQGGAPQATLIGVGDRVSAPQAALVNGASSHALDYDDVCLAMSGHPSVPVLPALFALAEQRGATGREVLAALVAGVELECRVGMLVMPAHYGIGFHSTGTLGTFGAAAACAHLMGLEQEQWLTALGIAGTQAAGLKSMFGTMCKPLHAGKAAQNGLLAATLAARGFTANPEVLDVAQGFTATQTTSPNPERALHGLGEDFAIRNVLFKYHAACYGTHETIEAVLRLKRQHNLAPDDVEAVRLVVPQGHLAMCNIQEPTTALEGKFSLRFTAALALSEDDTSDQAFTDEHVRQPGLARVRDRVSVATREGGAAQGWEGTQVTLQLKDGRELQQSVNLNEPATDLDLQWERLAAKFQSLAGPVVGATAAGRMLAAVRDFEQLDSLNDLVALASPAGVHA